MAPLNLPLAGDDLVDQGLLARLELIDDGLLGFDGSANVKTTTSASRRRHREAA